MGKNRKTRDRVLGVMEFEDVQELWLWLFEDEPPETIDSFVRAWLLRGYTEQEIGEALVIAGTKDYVAYDQKLNYVGGILRNLRTPEPQIRFRSAQVKLAALPRQ